VDNSDITLLPDSLFTCLEDNSLAEALKTLNPTDNPIFAAAAAALESRSPPPMKSSLHDWRIEDDLLFLKNCAYIPLPLRKWILELHHDHPTTSHPGHFGTEQTDQA